MKQKSKKNKKKGSFLTTLLLIFVFIVGLSLLLYPSFSDYWNSLHQSIAIANYSEAVSNLGDEENERLFNEAVEYNSSLKERTNPYLLSPDQKQQYAELLDVSGTGVMGYIEIPSLGISAPLYHTTEEKVLQVAIGHIEWSYLPVGGEGTHCVLSGHRGLPSARLFTDVDKMVVGDVFTICILDRLLTYEVDKISIVEPDETAGLRAEEGMDYCTLVTCTPYGINTHRLLVRGHRIENAEEAKTVRVMADAIQIDPMVVAPILSIPILAVLLAMVLMNDRDSYRNSGGDDDED